MISLRALALRVRPLVPPALLPLARRVWPSDRDRIRFVGPYEDWTAAANAARGWDDPGILEHAARTLAAELRRGRTTPRRELAATANWPAVACMLRTAAASGNELRVLDFGGGLGSVYFRSRRLLDRVRELRWSVVEQPHFVARGRAEFSTSELRFFPSLHEAWLDAPPNFVLLSGVLQYLPDPAALIRELRTRRPPAVLVDRTPVIDGLTDQVVVQRVPESMHRASYPARVFGRGALIDAFGDELDLIADFPASDGAIPFDRTTVEMIGLFFEARLAPASTDPRPGASDAGHAR